MTDMNTAAIYCRVSTQEQKRNGISLEAQVARCQQYAESMGFNVVHVGIEAQSAKDTDRQELQSILGMVAKKQIQHFIAIKLDRLTRETIDALQIGKTLQKKGCMLHFTNEYGQVDLNDPMQEFIYTQGASIAKLERRRIAMNTKFALDRKRQKNERISGQAPFGFMFHEGQVVENPAEQAIISRVHQLHSEGYSERKLIAQLTREGIANRNGNPLTRGVVRSILAQAA